jgi:YVTN family beta-propeller protein
VLPSGPDPEQVAISPDGKEVYVANEDAAQLSVIDTGDGHLIQSFKIGEEPEGVTVEPGGKRVWVTSEADGAVFVADLAAQKIARSVKVGPLTAVDRVSSRRLARVRAVRERRNADRGST